MNLVEVWFGILEREAIRRGVLTSVNDLHPKDRPFIDDWNHRPPSSGLKPPTKVS